MLSHTTLGLAHVACELVAPCGLAACTRSVRDSRGRQRGVLKGAWPTHSACSDASTWDTHVHSIAHKHRSQLLSLLELKKARRAKACVCVVCVFGLKPLASRCTIASVAVALAEVEGTRVVPKAALGPREGPLSAPGCQLVDSCFHADVSACRRAPRRALALQSSAVVCRPKQATFVHTKSSS